MPCWQTFSVEMSKCVLHALQYFYNLFRKNARKKSVTEVKGDQIALVPTSCKVGGTHPTGQVSSLTNELINDGQDELHTWSKNINGSSAELDLECKVTTKCRLNLIQQSPNWKTLCSVWVWRHHRPVYCMVDKTTMEQKHVYRANSFSIPWFSVWHTCLTLHCFYHLRFKMHKIILNCIKSINSLTK